MNGAEQRERHSRLNDLETVIVGLAGEMVTDRELVKRYHQACDARWQDSRTDADKQRAYVDGEDRRLERAFNRFACMTFWQRLRWIVRGV